ncbi:MAG: LarC family nickel insertion protein [Coriobacteriales bacterium]|jgi:uncharacterized protein (TIGR00299 family) protein|nr:LarC family nickel insertion protein [Coriobacteriales bacterium]
MVSDSTDNPNQDTACRILHFDFSTGASGDKILGALLEACEALGVASFAGLLALAESLIPNVAIARQKVLNGGIAATHLTVAESQAELRTWADIRLMITSAIDQGELSSSAGKLALKVFQSIATAEAAVHNQALEAVHFHEIGAADSIVDIVGSCYLLDRLSAQSVYASPLVLGYGTVQTAHGQLSVPAPATALLIVGLPVSAGSFAGELTTPTGAALAAAFVTHWQPFGTLLPVAIGYGAGTKQLSGTSNTVRLLVGEAVGATEPLFVSANKTTVKLTDDFGQLADDYVVPPDDSSLKIEQTPLLQSATLIEVNVDHRTPEALAFAAEELLSAGALDVWQEPITMKKGRLAVRLALLCSPERSAEFSERVLALTGSLGLRRRLVERVVLPRELLTIDTPWGIVRFKHGHFLDDTPFELSDVSLSNSNPGDADVGDMVNVLQKAAIEAGTVFSAKSLASNTVIWRRPEHDDVASLARQYGLDYQVLYNALLALVNQSTT